MQPSLQIAIPLYIWRSVKSRRQFLAKLSAWGINKNLKLPHMKILMAKRAARRQQGKETEFFLHGQPSAMERIERAVQRVGSSVSAPSPSAGM